MRTAALALACVALAAPAKTAAGQRPHVVMMVFDELPADALLDARGRVDADRFPGFARLARASTWFPNAHSVYDSTRHAVPAILDGRLPRAGRLADWRDHRGSVFDVFGRRGWRMEVSEEASTVCGPRWCGRRPETDFTDVIRVLAGPRGENLRAGLERIRPSRRATFWFFHALLPHTPWIYLPSGRRYPATIDDGPRGFSGPRSFHDRFLAIQARQRQLLQLGFLDREVGRLIDRLRNAGMWRRTMLVVTADHGLSFATGVKGRRYALPRNLHEIAPVPLFIRAPGQTRGRVRRAAARTVDVVPTMADVLGLRLGWSRRAGRSALGPRARRRRSVAVYRRDVGRVFRMSLRELRSRRAGSRRRWARVFRGGLHAIGPNRRLLGRSAADKEQLAPGEAHATLDRAGSYESVDPASGVVPAWVTGVIEGDGRRSPRELAVAVNGRIAAVMPSVFLRDDGGAERFSAMVPEDVLRAGANEVEVYEVERGRALRPLTAP